VSFTPRKPLAGHDESFLFSAAQRPGELLVIPNGAYSVTHYT
jgi:hypothetical protein